MATIIADDGSILASVSLAPGIGSTLTIARVRSGKGRLIGYYFGAGKRAVRVDAGMFCIPGMLRTDWLGAERIWQIQMSLDHGRDEQLSDNDVRKPAA